MTVPRDVLERCELVTAKWAQLLTAVENQIDEPPAFQAPLESLLKSLVARYPEREDLLTHLGEQYINSQILSDTQLLKQAQEDPSLDERGREILGQWEQTPAFYAVFFITRRLGNSLYEIEDLTRGGRYNLFSPGLQKLQNRRESRAATYIALLVDNGLCLQTASMIHYNRLGIDDFDFMGHIADETLYREKGIDGVFKGYPSLFLTLFNLSEVPSLTLRGVEVVGHLAAIGEPSYPFEAPYWRTVTSGESSQYIFDEASEEMVNTYGDRVFFELPGLFNIRLFNIKGSWYLLTHCQEAFEVFSAMMGYPTLGPQYRLSTAMVLFLEQDGYPMPWSPFLLVESGEDDESEEMGDRSQKVEQLNAFMKEYNDALNEGKSVDKKRLGRQHGISLQDVESLMERLNEVRKSHTWSVPPEEEEYQVSGVWPIPPPALVRHFNNSLVGSLVFFILEGPEGVDRFNAYTQGEWTQRVLADGVAALVEDIFLEEFDYDDSGYSMLNLLLWIVLHKREESVMVRSIAVEGFKLFPYLSLENDFDSFVETFSEGVIKALVATSLLKLKKRPLRAERRRGLFTVQATDLLSSLFSPIPHSV